MREVVFGLFFILPSLSSMPYLQYRSQTQTMPQSFPCLQNLCLGLDELGDLLLNLLVVQARQ